MISPEEAWQRISAHLQPLPAERVARREALGRVLAETVHATVDVPAHDVSAMDGFALAGPVSADQRLPIGGMLAAGDPPQGRLEAGSAWRIMTGAPLPAGADRIIPVEQTELLGDRIRLLAAVEAGAHVRYRAEVLHRGAVLFAPGTVLTPGALALLATHGHSSVCVHRRPRVAVLATGDEVIAPDLEPRRGQVRDSHTDFLLAAGRSLGLEFESLGIAPDRRDALRERVEHGTEREVLLVCGGVSMGEFDYVEGVLSELGCQVLFDAVAMQPGKPLVVAHHRRGLVVGLPGNPASVMVGFWLFVRPLLRRLQGLQDGYWQGALSGTLEAPLPGAKGRDRFLAASVRWVSERPLVTPRSPKGSHDLAAYAQGSALVRIPAGAPPASAGEACEILPLSNWPMVG